MRKAFLKIFIIPFLFTLLFFSSPVLAVDHEVVCPPTPCPPGEICIENPICAQSIGELIDNILNFIFAVATVLAPLMIVIAGFYFLTAGGDPARIKTAKDIILYTLIGYGIILLSKGLILVLRDVLGAGNGG